MSVAAVFLDRDGTIIQDVRYIARPDQVALIPGAAAAIARLNAARVPVIVVTNQSGIARGYYTAADYDRVRTRMNELLGHEGAGGGARVDATYMCPHHPDHSGACECRKPGTLLYRRAADELGLDLTRSWFLGDRLRDVEPARALGGHGILVPSADTPAGDVERARAEFSVAGSLDEAVVRVIQSPR
ncbi:MAG: HAD family hydrolase [Gemmatimonadaceae bacterium]